MIYCVIYGPTKTEAGGSQQIWFKFSRSQHLDSWRCTRILLYFVRCWHCIECHSHFNLFWLFWHRSAIPVASSVISPILVLSVCLRYPLKIHEISWPVGPRLVKPAAGVLEWEMLVQEGCGAAEPERTIWGAATWDRPWDLWMKVTVKVKEGHLNIVTSKSYEISYQCHIATGRCLNVLYATCRVVLFVCLGMSKASVVEYRHWSTIHE